MVFVHLKIISISIMFHRFFREGLREKIIEICCPFRPPWTHRSPWAGSKKWPLRPPEMESSRGHWPPKMTIGSWMTTFPFRMITFSGLNCWTSGGYYKGNGFNFTSNICCLIPLNVRKVPSNHPCKFETKKNILHSIILFLALPPTHITKLPKTFEWIPKPQKSQQRPKAPPQGGTTSALLEKVVLKHLASMETRNKKQTHVLAEKQAQKFGIHSVF